MIQQLHYPPYVEEQKELDLESISRRLEEHFEELWLYEQHMHFDNIQESLDIKEGPSFEDISSEEICAFEEMNLMNSDCKVNNNKAESNQAEPSSDNGFDEKIGVVYEENWRVITGPPVYDEDPAERYG